MGLLPAINLPRFRPLQVEMYQRDPGKRCQDNRGRRQRRVALMARESVVLLRHGLTHLALDQPLHQ